MKLYDGGIALGILVVLGIIAGMLVAHKLDPKHKDHHLQLEKKVEQQPLS
jgi:hypothetical protein